MRACVCVCAYNPWRRSHPHQFARIVNSECAVLWEIKHAADLLFMGKHDWGSWTNMKRRLIQPRRILFINTWSKLNTRSLKLRQEHSTWINVFTLSESDELHTCAGGRVDGFHSMATLSFLAWLFQVSGVLTTSLTKARWLVQPELV